MKILDLGCGIGFWVCEFGLRGLHQLHAADLTEQALDLTRKRLDVYQVSAELSQQNAEQLNFSDATFDHVNCQGVIHHTPNTAQSVAEIARVLKPGGTASVSVYHRNLILRAWPYLRWFGLPLAKLGGGLKGRGREKIFLESDIDEIVKLYDGVGNPVGKSYTKQHLVQLVQPHFEIIEIYLHFFPARALPFSIPHRIHQWLDKHLAFMIYASLRKPCAD